MVALDDSRRLAVLRATGLLDSAPEPAFDRLTAMVVRLLRVPMALVSLIDRDRHFVKSAAGPDTAGMARVFPLSHSFCQFAVAQGGELIVTDAPHDPRLHDHPGVTEHGVVAYAGVPLEVDGETIGVLCAVDYVTRAWTPDELDVLRELARLTESELLRREAVAELNRKNDLMSAVFASMEDVLIVADRAGNVVMTNDAADRLFGGDDTVAADGGEGGDSGPAWGLYHPDRESPLTIDQIPLMRALEGESVRQAVVFVKVASAPEGRWHSVNASPVLGPDGTVHGAVVVHRNITELREAHARLENAAVRDELTGLLNRRGFLEQAARAVLIADRKQRSLALFYVDLNGMKAINDLQGHAMGDRALIETAELLRRVFRGTDLLCRLGGDEFVALAPEYDLGDDGESIRARMRAAITDVNRAGGRRYRLSVSTGVTLYNPTTDHRSIDELLAEADARMYEAKQARRMAGTGRIDITQG